MQTYHMHKFVILKCFKYALVAEILSVSKADMHTATFLSNL